MPDRKGHPDEQRDIRRSRNGMPITGRNSLLGDTLYLGSACTVQFHNSEFIALTVIYVSQQRPVDWRTLSENTQSSRTFAVALKIPATWSACPPSQDS
ncbi:hypothetical protein AVEN_82129-1 [Araneus ventricosus]|uniref:Uncharacterized protein n=1 Tax=Araneus ventricosus TaxID=182803 RepID=A0A4Y2RBL1_ARAVE|nr:hypothetical protein AVEN_82129-1 [Araneus ventricosus]